MSTFDIPRFADGDRIGNLLAEMRGYVDELRIGMVALKATAVRQAPLLQLNGHDGLVIQVLRGRTASNIAWLLAWGVFG